MEKKIKKKVTFQKVLSIITDILIYPIIALAIFSSFVMLNAKRDNEVYAIFGYSIVKILSGSMTASGFEKGDLVILHSVNTDDLRVGDDIAFYRYLDTKDPNKNQLVKIPEDFSVIPEITSQERVVGTKTKKDAAKEKCPVIFHRIIAVYQAADGTRFFQTQGTSNPSPDNTYVREDFVVGMDIGTPEWVNQTLQFCSSPRGMIILVILPLSILIFFQLLEIFEIINQLLLEKKVLAMEVRYDFQDCYKNNIGIEMRYFDQIYFYDAVPVVDKKPVKDFLWGNLYHSSKKKDIKKLAIVNEAVELHKDSADEYWNYVIEKVKRSKIKRKLRKNYVLAKTIKVGQEKNNAIENYEKLKYTEEYIKAQEKALKNKDIKQEKNKDKKQKLAQNNNVEAKETEQKSVQNNNVEVKQQTVDLVEKPVEILSVNKKAENKTVKKSEKPDKATKQEKIKPENKLEKVLPKENQTNQDVKTENGGKKVEVKKGRPPRKPKQELEVKENKNITQEKKDKDKPEKPKQKTPEKPNQKRPEKPNKKN